MAALKCPKCETLFPAHKGWAQAAVSTLMPAPAIPDMATQVRCPHCGHLFAESEVRYLGGSRPLGTILGIALLVVAVLAWVAYRFA